MTTFVMPDFLSRVEYLGAQSGFPALEKMLSKAEVTAENHDNVYELIYSLMCKPEEANKKMCETSQAPLGVSALMQLAESGQATEGWSCCASPVVVLPNRDHLDLAQISGFDITDDEAKSFCDEFNDYFMEDGLRFSFQGPDRWYCHAQTGFPVAVASAFTAQGQNIAEHIPQGKEGVMWRKVFNDMQLLLHHSVTNQKRATLNKPEINSLWLWGGGGLMPDFVGEPHLSLKTTDLFARGLALRGGISSSPDNGLMETELIVADIETHEWLDWDEKYLTSALQSLKSGKIKKITFYLDLNNSFTLKKMDLLRFWRKDKSILDFCHLSQKGE